jgi:hypothetical protein
MAGAAMLYDANGKFRRVKLANGQNQVEVILRNSYRDTQLSWGIWGFSWTLKATNYAERLVDAVPRRGSVSGSPWNRQPVSTSSLRAKCTQIEKEQEAKEKAQKERDISKSSEGGGQSGSNGGSSYRVPYFGGYYVHEANDDRIPVVTSYECYGGGCSKTGATGKPLRVGSSRIYRLAD